MNDVKRLFVTLLLFSTLLGSLGQLSFKTGLNSGTLAAEVLYVGAGLVLYGLATVIYLYILSRANLSWAYGFVGFSYIFAMVFALFILKETIAIDAWVGVLLIAIGTAFIGSTEHS